MRNSIKEAIYDVIEASIPLLAGVYALICLFVLVLYIYQNWPT